jgi:Cu(I)/Ag(I) efflux system membrane protein CusA/SilA
MGLSSVCGPLQRDRLELYRAIETGNLETLQDLWRTTIEGATYRARPLLMTVASDVIGLLPIMWGVGTGSETMRRIAAPMVGGVLTATLVTLIVIPVLFTFVHGWRLSGIDEGPRNEAA